MLEVQSVVYCFSCKVKESMGFKRDGEAKYIFCSKKGGKGLVSEGKLLSF